MPGILYVVATPIGNLEDITLRALRVLREAAVIAAEDTRRTARLLQHYSISTRTTSLHQHNEYAQSSSLIARLQAGESVALVSDAGTPLISDPGMLLVAAAHAAGIRVEPVPGPSAVMALLSGSGLPFQEFLFVGFPPARSHARKNWLRGLAEEPRLLVLYETPHRITDTLNDIREILGERLVALGRELTKLHEELVVRPISAHLTAITAPRGEYTLAIAGPDPGAMHAPEIPDAASLLAEFGRMTNDGSRRDVVRKLADKYHVAPREMYRLLERSRER
jgi:16S rRNA (cytidine1402-2'-O)-methyltransferase